MDSELKLYELQKIVHAVLKEVKIKEYDYEDLYMEGILTGLKAIKDYDPSYGTKKTSYIYMRVYRRYVTLYRLNRAKKRKTEQKIVLENTNLSETGAFYGKPIYQEPHQEQEVVKRELKEEIDVTMKEILKEEELKIIILHLKGYTVEEIALRHNLKTRQVSNKLYYIKKKLKKNRDKFEKSRKML